MTPVVDAALAIDVVDPDRIVYQPWSLGGVPGAACRRLRAPPRGRRRRPGPDRRRRQVHRCIASKLGFERRGRRPGFRSSHPRTKRTIMSVINGDRWLHWKIVQRGFWTNAASDLSSWIAEMVRWKLDADTVAQIRCPDARHRGPDDMASSQRQGALRRAACAPRPFMQLHRCRRRGRCTARCSIGRWPTGGSSTGSTRQARV